MAGFKQTNTSPNQLHPAVQALRERSAKDIDAFVQSAIHIQDDQGRDRILKYNYSQLQMAKMQRRQMREKGLVRAYILKSRQVGSTTRTQNYNFAQALCLDNRSVATVAHLEDRASDIIGKAQYAYSKLPDLLKLTLSRDSKQGFMFADTHSKQIIVPAKSLDAVRSGTFQDIHLSEWPLYGDPEHVLYEVSQVCHMVPGTSIIIEGTGRREGSYAHWFWRRCKKGQEVFEAHFLAWQNDPNCTYKFLNDRDRDDKLEEAYRYEPQLKDRAKLFKLTPGNIYYSYLVLRDQAYGNWNRYLEDYPCDDEEPWRSKGDQFFGSNNISKLLLVVAQYPYDAFIVDLDHLETDFKNPYEDLEEPAKFDPLTEKRPNIMIWTRPRDGHQYVVSGDSAGGATGSDPSSSAIIDMHTGEQVAEFWGIVQPHQHGNVMASLCNYYNGAVGAPECNGIGISTLNQMQRKYHRFYNWRAFDNRTYKLGNKVGWWTSVKTRAMMLSLALRVVQEVAKDNPAAQGLIKSPRLVNEMRSFIEDDETGIPEASGSNHDDTIIAWSIAWIVSQEETKGGNQDILRQLQMQTDVEIPKLSPNSSRLDVASAIASIRKNLGIEESYNAVPISEKESRNTYPF